MTEQDKDEILVSLVKGVNSLQITVNEIRSEMKNMATKEDLKRFATKEDLKDLKNEMITRMDEQDNLIRCEVVDAIKELSHISYDRYVELKQRIISNEKDIENIKLAIAN